MSSVKEGPLSLGETISFNASKLKTIQGETVLRVCVTESDKDCFGWVKAQNLEYSS